uniref:RNase H domain-containing protein n=1 Tax=Heterorhabditis bacteriophora TaxID=37862 RepID=A0A1I7X189_HETBA
MFQFFAYIDIKDGDERDSEGKKPTTSSVDWPVVYVGASYRLFHSGFVLASYATHWPISECGGGTVHRLTKPTTTLFKAQLIGIEKALTQIRFRFEPFTKNSMEWLSVKAKCEEGIKFPILWKDKSEYRLSIGKIVSQNYSETTNLQRVRIFKNNNTIRRNVVWENMDGEPAVNTNANHEITVKTLYSALISALTKAVELNLSSLIVRTDSRRLIRACESWLPVWERNEWRNSLNKRVAYCDEWKTIYALKKKIKIYWELMDPFTDEDFKAASFLQPPKSIKIDSILKNCCQQQYGNLLWILLNDEVEISGADGFCTYSTFGGSFEEIDYGS